MPISDLTSQSDRSTSQSTNSTPTDLHELVDILEAGCFTVSAAAHAALFQLAEMSLNRIPQPLEQQFVISLEGLKESTATESVVLVVEGLPWERLAYDIMDIFEGYYYITDPFIVGTKRDYVAFVYLCSQESAYQAINDLDGVSIREYSEELGGHCEYFIRVRMATWQDIRYGLEVKGRSTSSGFTEGDGNRCRRGGDGGERAGEVRRNSDVGFMEDYTSSDKTEASRESTPEIDHYDLLENGTIGGVI